MHLNLYLNKCIKVVKYLSFLLLIVWNDGLFAQQDPQISQFMINKLLYNPAFTGIDDVTSVTSLIRNQWVGLDGHPVTKSISIDAPIPTGGVGLVVINDVIGTESLTKIYFNYAFRLMYEDRSSLSFGASGGINQFSLDGSIYRSPGGIYENGTIEHNDGKIPNGIVSDNVLDFNFGFYYSGRNIYAGLSVAHLLEPKNKIGSIETYYKRNLYFVTGLDHKLNELFSLRPSLLLKTELNKMQVDLNFNCLYDNNIWFGASFRGITKHNNDAFILMAGMNVTNQFVIGYSYDIHTSSIGKYSSGTHEFVLNYKILGWGIYKGAKLIYCPRFL